MKSSFASRFSKITIIAVAGFFVVLLIYSFAKDVPSFYRFEIRVALTALFLLLLLSLKLGPTLRDTVAVSLLSIGLAFIAGEVFLWIGEERGSSSRYFPHVAAAKKANLPYDPRPPLQVLRDLRGGGIDVYPVGGTPAVLGTEDGVDGTELLVLSTISNVTNLGCAELGTYKLIEADEYGFNNPLGIWERDRIDIISVGDSFTHADCVDPDKNSTALIRDVYKNTLNLGHPGGGQLVQLARIKEYGASLEPRVVLWFYYEGNDLLNIQQLNRGFPQLREYLDSDYRQNLVSKQATIDRGWKTKLNRQIKSSNNRSHNKSDVVGVVLLRRLRHQSRLWMRGIAGCVPTDQSLVLFESALRAGKETVDSWGGKIFFVYLPAWERYRDGKEPCIVGQHDFEYREQVLGIVGDVGLVVIDVKEAFDAHPDPLALFPFRLRGHYNEAGYKLVADTVLQSNGLTEWLAEAR